MSRSIHTYGPTCYLARYSSSTNSKGEDDMPPVNAQFFYSSHFPIDDPLSASPTPTGTESKSIKYPLRPFSAYDNNALEEAWLCLGPKSGKKHQKRSKSSSPSRNTSPSSQATARRHGKKQTQADVIKPTTMSTAPTRGDNSESGPVASGIDRPYKRGRSIHKKSGKQGRTSANEDFHNEGREAGETSDKSPQSNVKSDIPQCCKDLERGDQLEHMTSVKSCPCGDAEESSHTEHAELRNQCSCGDTGGETAEDTVLLKPCICGHMEGDPHAANSGLSNSCTCENMEESAQTEHVDSSNKCSCGNMDGGVQRALADSLTREELDETSEQADNSGRGELKELKPKVKTKQSAPKSKFGKAQVDGRVDTEWQETSEAFVSKNDGSISESDNGLDSRSRSSNKASKVLGFSKDKLTRRNENSGHPEYHADVISSSFPSQSADTGTTGLPFIKYSSRSGSPNPQSSQQSIRDESRNKGPEEERASANIEHSPSREEYGSMETEVLQVPGCRAHKALKEPFDVTVGVSRLHLVQLPALQMKPIYWSPVHDISSVTRGTWFYKDTMYPVEPPVANQLEKGYRELRPWSQTWSDELNSAMEVGAAGEEKIAHRLWQKDDDQVSSQKPPSHGFSTDPYCAAICFNGEAAAQGNATPEGSVSNPSTARAFEKQYSNAQIIYKDAQYAFILKPSLQPSAYYGRRPLQKIRKGIAVGIQVVRGFNWTTWEKLHPSKKSSAHKKAEETAAVSGDADVGKRNACPACRAQEEPPRVSDLILVIHGIGQKLSERVESFHFTHAINAFRRNVNVELGNESVQRVLRKNLGGVMVLPINWRSTLSFEEGGPLKDGDEDYQPSDFTLKDITPGTLLAVRSIISDVMLDIPYYMSNHKQKMIHAVISEANRVYRLWCKNNPGFQNDGQVHLIAHSLGSVMAVDVLSKQPTFVPKVNLLGKRINTKHLDFNTTNVFFAGSPAAFFLLLEKGKLVPRKGRNKPGAEHGDDQDKAIVGDAGTYGCLAVDNIYNIMNFNDPIAYRMNATIDPQYALSLKIAQVPSSTTGFFESLGNAMRTLAPGVSTSDLAVGEVSKPAGLGRLPSQLEMEVHDFTREEIAEKKAYLLNDNGQIDWFLSSGSGALDLPYLHMLSAHSSYWASADFIRMVVVEVGRRRGRAHTLPNMRAVKVGHKV